MGDSVGIRALQQNASAVVARAAGGELIEITDHGKPVAQIVPLRTSWLDRLIEAGRARPARRHLADLPSPLKPAKGARRLTELLAEARADER